MAAATPRIDSPAFEKKPGTPVLTEASLAEEDMDTDHQPFESDSELGGADSEKVSCHVCDSLLRHSCVRKIFYLN